MSTIILSSILSKAGSIFGPIGQIAGSELGALLGAQLDNAIFGLDAEQKITHGARLKNLYNAPICLDHFFQSDPIFKMNMLINTSTHI